MQSLPGLAALKFMTYDDICVPLNLLQTDLAAKYLVIFQNYGLDLEAVQKLYEKHKHAPPVVRNAPPVAGNIMWARQLLRRIEMPMHRYMLPFGSIPECAYICLVNAFPALHAGPDCTYVEHVEHTGMFAAPCIRFT